MLSADPLLNQTLGGCAILEQIGEGGMATVYRAQRESDEGIVAVKIIAPKLANAADFAARFRREARLMASLDHPHILPVYDYGTQDNLIYLVMRLLEGGALNKHIAERAFPLEDAVRIVDQIAAALDYAHARGIIHRDLKPANVLMDADGNTYLTDFGIAKWTEETTGLTMTGMLMGTPGYMAPEQWRTEPVDPRTDVYALGVMVFEMLSGKMPFDAETPFSLMYRHLDEPPPAVTKVNARLPKGVDRVIRRAMAKIPDRRYPSAGALALSFRETLDEPVSFTSAWPTLDDQTAPHMAADTRRAISRDDTQLDDTFIQPGTEEREDTFVLERAPDDGGTIPPARDEDTYYTEVGLERETYNAIDVGARTLLSRAREIMRESEGETAVLAGAVAHYVEDLREQAKTRPAAEQSPYKALESYDISDNRLFYGREQAVDALLARSPFHRFTVLHAESGAGKTSLIRAGVMPRLLAGGFLPLYIAVRRRPPHEAIKRMLLPDPTTAPALTGASLHAYLKHISEATGPNREIFIFIDQFETFLTDVFTDEQRSEFISEIAECLDDQLLPVRITLAMRTEYFGLLASFQPHIPQPFAHEFLLRSLSFDEARRAMILPVRNQGYNYDPDVSDIILQDLTNDRGEIAPPQLQLVGSAMIDALPPDRTTVTQQDYIEAGGAAGVLRSYLERLLANLPAATRRLAQVVIESLVREDQTRDVRTADSLRAELEVLNIPPDRLDDVLHALRENHVLRAVETDEGLAYELVHDYLAMQIQLDPQTAARKAAQELLDRRVRDYERYQSLLTRQEIDVITAQRDQLRLNDTAHTLITRSQAVQRRQRRIAIALSTAAVLGLIGALVIGLFAAARESQNRQDRLNNAQTAEARVKTERDTAMTTESRMLADLATQQLGIDPVASLNLGVQALTPRDRPYVPEAELALSQAVQASTERVYMPSGGRVYGAAWNTTSTRVLSWSADHTARVWDAETGDELLRLDDHTSAVITAAWSPGETRILTGDYDGAARVYDAQTGALVATLDGHTDHLVGASWDSAGKRVLTWSDDGTARIWNVSGETPPTESVIVLEGHTAGITFAAWSPDDTRILTAGADFDVRAWDSKTGAEIALLRGHVNRLQGAAWNADGTQIVTYGDDMSARVWDAAAGDVLLTLEGHTDRVTAAVWSPDESLIATTGFDGIAIVWDAETGEERARLAANTVLDGVTWDTAGARLLTFGEPDGVGIWNADTGALISLLGGHTDTVLGAAWNTDETLILTWSEDGTARVWDTTGPAAQEIAQFVGHNDRLTGAAWDRDENRILTSGADGSARIWAVFDGGIPAGNGEEQRFVVNPADPAAGGHVFDAVWSAGESQVVTAHQDGTIRVWDAATGEQLRQLDGHTDQVERLAWSPDGTRLLSASVDGTARLWDMQTGGALAILDHAAPVIWIAWNTGGTRILTGSEDTTAALWDAATGAMLQRFEGHSGTIASAAWNADETRILTASNDGTLRLWDAASGDTLNTITVSDLPLLGGVWSADETRALVWGFDGMAHVIDLTTGDTLVSLQGHTDWVVRALWNADESRVLTVSSDTTARLWDSATGTEIQRFEGHTDSVIGAAWDAAETRILTWSVDGSARVWDVDSGQDVLRLQGHAGRIWSAAWDTGHTRILTASDDGTARIWTAWPDLDSLLHAASELITRPLSDDQREQFFLPQTETPPTPTSPPPTASPASVLS
ncbi:MAG: protein kinase [Anaerolineae bacterium]|nr:protein kinase [Anaerolineae bacterium]